MTTQEIINYLVVFNAWRRGKDERPQPDPREAGEFIDAAIARLREQESELVEWDTRIDAIMPDNCKDYWKAKPLERPEVVAGTILALRKREQLAWAHAEEWANEAATIRADKERLDWLESNARNIGLYRNGLWSVLMPEGVSEFCDTARAAIDAAKAGREGGAK